MRYSTRLPFHGCPCGGIEVSASFVNRTVRPSL